MTVSIALVSVVETNMDASRLFSFLPSYPNNEETEQSWRGLYFLNYFNMCGKMSLDVLGRFLHVIEIFNLTTDKLKRASLKLSSKEEIILANQCWMLHRYSANVRAVDLLDFPTKICVLPKGWGKKEVSS